MGSMLSSSNMIAPPGASSSGGIVSINDDTTPAQVLDTGNGGTDFTIADNGLGTHTFQLPIASAINTGKLSNMDWSIFNNKVSSQWITNGSDIYYSTGKVGIQTATPTANFQVAQSTTGPGTVTNSASSGAVTGVGTQFLNTFKVGDTITINGQTVAISAIADDTHMTTATITSANSSVGYTLVGGTRFSVAGNGNVGIGTATASGYLECVSDTYPIFKFEKSGPFNVRLVMKPYSGSQSVTIESYDSFAGSRISSNIGGLSIQSGSGLPLRLNPDGGSIQSDALRITNSVDAQVALEVNGTLGQTANLVEIGPHGAPTFKIAADGTATIVSGSEIVGNGNAYIFVRDSSTNALAMLQCISGTVNIGSFINGSGIVNIVSQNNTAISISQTLGISLPVAGQTISLKAGTNQRAGNATLGGGTGTVTIANTTVTANTLVVLTRKTSGGTIGTAVTYTVSAGVSFTITSDNILDTSTFTYLLLELN